MSNEIKIGDVVRLKSGGPKMTVASIVMGAKHNNARCLWFNEGEDLKTDDNNDPNVHRFPVVCLDIA